MDEIQMADLPRGAALPGQVKIVEVGPRDGLQAEKDEVPTDIKIELVNRLSGSGLSNIEAASFVSPKWVPQMADGARVMTAIERRPGVTYSALVPNQRGLESALESKVDEAVIFGAASEAFSQRNINCSIAEASDRFSLVARAAKDAGIRLRGSISCCFGCPYQGAVSQDSVLDAVRRFADLGCDEIDLADTIGVGTAMQVASVVEEAARVFPMERLSGHFHDTYGQALANIFAAMQVGMNIFHSSVAGLGGCPYAKGATGNVATEDVLYLLNGLGIETGIDIHTIVAAGDFISRALGKPNGSRVGRALLAKAT
ncbi:hydroxymethylglutaryl-CoA lyase [Paraburkholderia sp. HD33-4]|uniref:hydroxymethylglutaryl-CoA lyase n=1 Tax=Paraburkholderia sp. HD33-4 TaxID=2883242 RepID=UPI001F31FBA7|nr:hydroxymethylglutaryl-CoA lyase [Paraburkholderia sp. HD33-4]